MVDFFLYFGIALLVALFLGPVIIPQLKKMKFGQAIREEGPEAHLSKSGTPTMGGLIFIVAFMTPSLIFLDIENSLVQLLWFSVLGFGAIGFTDD
jgi:phospho-N-acetylmuramoyl-pentapeptide-transferase